MKTVLRFLVVAAATFFSFVASAQSYTIDWYKVAGGGGASTSGQYHLSGTIGQPDAGGPMSGGGYFLTDGFWSLVSVVQTPGAPNLSITLAPNQVVVSWPSSVTGWTLQTNHDLATGSWGTYVGPVLNNRITNSAPTGNLFFRLSH